MMISVLASGLAGYSRKLELIFMLRWVSPDRILIGRFIKTNSDWLETFWSQFLMMFASEIAFGAFISYSMEILGPRLVFENSKLGPCSPVPSIVWKPFSKWPVMDRCHCEFHWFIWNGHLFNPSVFYYRLEVTGFNDTRINYDMSFISDDET